MNGDHCVFLGQSDVHFRLSTKITKLFAAPDSLSIAVRNPKSKHDIKTGPTSIFKIQSQDSTPYL